jgi:hypothetical protein
VGVGRSVDGVRGMHRFSAQVGGRVLHQGDVVAELHRKAPCRLDAGVGDHADDDHALNAELLELLVEVRVGEPARPPVLVHDEAAGKRERQVFDALELSVAFALPELANFEPVVPWQLESVSEKQADSLRSFGIDPASVRNRGHGSLILKHLYARREAGLATYRQLRYLIRFGHKSPLAASFEEASAFLDRYFGRKRRFQPSTAAVGV